VSIRSQRYNELFLPGLVTATRLRYSHPAMQQHADTLIRRAATELFCGQPTKLLTEAIGAPRSTVRSWLAGRRRPPIFVLDSLVFWLRNHASKSVALADEIAGVIAERQSEIVRRRGFCEVRKRSGTVADGRWKGAQR